MRSKGWILLLLAGLIFAIGRGPHAVRTEFARQERVASLSAADAYGQMRCERESNPALGAFAALRCSIFERTVPRRPDERWDRPAGLSAAAVVTPFLWPHMHRPHLYRSLSGARPADLVRLLRRFVI